MAVPVSRRRKNSSYTQEMEAGRGAAFHRFRPDHGRAGDYEIRHGSAKSDKYLPDILASNVWWCQGYSEPGSGSDLASLQMKAEDKGDHFLCAMVRRFGPPWRSTPI
jgi:alkylation response protein AidB-like acyl-CoA dehydrogenase